MKIKPKFPSSFFFQFLFSFVFTTLLMGFGMYVASRYALAQLEEELHQNPPPHLKLWVERLASYYEKEQSWDNVGVMIQSYPRGEDWGPWDESAWQMNAMVASMEGLIIAAPPGFNMMGYVFSDKQLLRLATPIAHQTSQIGWLILLPFDFVSADFSSTHSVLFANALKRFIFAEAGLILLTLLLGALLARRIIHPLIELTNAVRALGTGDLSVRVPVKHRGEIRELERAFNAMAADLSYADEVRRNMTADVAHELRTPLSIIRGKLEGVLDGVYPTTPEHLTPILEETELLTHLVEDLRLLALAEAGQLPLEKRPLDIGDLLRDAQVNFTPQANDRGVTLILDLPPDLPQVAADWRRIAQILSNLLTNALRHTPEGGNVTLMANTHADQIEVRVTDTGSGIIEEDLPYVFERFWRGDKSRARTSGGSGLGLAIAKQLVEMHGGTLSVDSAPGKGATFCFTLPSMQDAK